MVFVIMLFKLIWIINILLLLILLLKLLILGEVLFYVK